jgi:peptide deformylase
MSMVQTKLKLRFYGDSSLRKRSRPLMKVTDEDRVILREMVDLMKISGGVGLAAPQVGINKQMLVADVGDGVVILINPRIRKKSGAEVFLEGCLSLPGISVKVKRAKKIVVTGLNEQNQKCSITASDLLACTLQHEIDHLRGRLIIDHVNFLARLELKKKLKELKEGAKDV